MTTKIKIKFFISGCILFLLFWNHELLFYGFSQLKGQLHIIFHAEPITQVLQDTAVPDEWKKKLLLIGKIKSFANDSLGLLPTKNYSTVYNQHNQTVLWVLTGCQPFKFIAKTWWFPILGDVSYKGFFNKKKGEEELTLLRNEGFDADLSPTGGWSTLGWFSDPVLSNMLKKSDGVLAELIIHEISHGTIYLKSHVDFNENLATCIGEQGAIRFLKNTYDDTSVQLNTYLHYKSDEELFGNYLIHSQQKLDSLYNSFQENDSYSSKLKMKKLLISQIISGMDSLPFYNKERYHFSSALDSLPDNTFFMGNSRYRRNQQYLNEIIRNEFNENLTSFISFLKNSNEDIILNKLNK